MNVKKLLYSQPAVIDSVRDYFDHLYTVYKIIYFSLLGVYSTTKSSFTASKKKKNVGHIVHICMINIKHSS